MNAFVNDAASPVPDPIALYEFINGASAHTAATVVSSLMLRPVVLVRVQHGPIAPIKASAPLFVPEAMPGFPPVATRYTSVDGEGHA